MKRLLSAVVLLLIVSFINSCGLDPKNGKDGESFLLKLSEEPAGKNCVNGGTRVDSGMDINSDGILDEDEITVTKYVCDGTDGTSGNDGDDGKEGAEGSSGEDGIDGINGNDGTNGTDGEDGTNGADGNDAACYGNSAPVIDSILINDNAYNNSELKVVLSEIITIQVNSTDAESDLIQYSLIGPSGASINDYGNGDFEVTGLGLGIHSFTLIISDGCQILIKSLAFSLIINTKESYSLSTGSQSSCFLSSGKAYSWGINYNGELGAGIQDDYKKIPVAVDGSGVLSGKTAITVSSGEYHTCILDSAGEIFCWGVLLAGSEFLPNPSPVAVDMSGMIYGKVIVKLVTGNNTTCALDENGELFCWGYNNYGQLGEGTQENQPVPVRSLEGMSLKEVSLGKDHGCGIKNDGKLYCWGTGDKGQLGDGSSGCIIESDPNECLVPIFSTSAIEVDSEKIFVSVSSGHSFNCAISTEGEVYCWGLNSSGQLGDGTTADKLKPVKVDGLLSGKTVVALSVGFSHACAVDSTNGIYCWGDNFNGMLGDGSNIRSLMPVAVDMSGDLSGASIKEISAGGYNTCILNASDEIFCWGLGDVGQLGNNLTLSSNVPVKVNPLP